MNRIAFVCYLCLVIVLTIPGIASGQQPQQALTNTDVVDMLAAGLSAEVVTAKIGTSPCRFDTSPDELKHLKAAGVPDSVIVAMVQAPVGQESEAEQPHENQTASFEAASEREKLGAKCPECKRLLLCYVDSQTGALTESWASKEQLKLIKEGSARVAAGKQKQRFWWVRSRENADYFLFWTRAVGSRPFVLYVPHTETETGQFSGSHSGMVGSEYTWGNFRGTVQVTKTYYTRETREREFVDVSLSVYDARSGRKVYETWHRGNWIWSKPDKDCLEDAIKFLRELVVS